MGWPIDTWSGEPVMGLDTLDLHRFVAESNRIEGIIRDPTGEEVDATRRFLDFMDLSVQAVVGLVAVYQPNAVLRTTPDLNVRVGNHVAPRGGPEIAVRLRRLLSKANQGHATPWWVHHRYETLHPFTDGNGRSGRAIWLWQVVRETGVVPQIGFLHLWYYQSLAGERGQRTKPLVRA